MTTTVGVSGANGYIGKALVKELNDKNISTVEFVRLPKGITNQAKFSISDSGLEIDESSLSKVNIFIHCAWSLAGKSEVEAKKNIAASERLVMLCKAKNIKLIFISSMASFDGCKSIYGKSKAIIEKRVTENNGIVLRPATVWGDSSEGIVGAILKLISKFHFAPLIGLGNSKIYGIYLPDLVSVICRIVIEVSQGSSIFDAKVYNIAFPEQLTLKSFFTRISKRANRFAVFIPFPAVILFYVLKLFESLNLRPPLRSDSVVSISRSNPNPISQQFALPDPFFNLITNRL